MNIPTFTSTGISLETYADYVARLNDVLLQQEIDFLIGRTLHTMKWNSQTLLNVLYHELVIRGRACIVHF